MKRFLPAVGATVVVLIVSSLIKKDSVYGNEPIMLTEEALDNNTSSPEERAAVSGQVMPKMLIGGFVCVTIVSVLVAGILVKFI